MSNMQPVLRTAELTNTTGFSLVALNGKEGPF